MIGMWLFGVKECSDKRGTVVQWYSTSIRAWQSALPGEGAKARWLSSTTKRYFTINFTSQLFFYAQSESQKTVSHPIRFKD